ncbi:prepilin peptidase [Amycolatopsis taiwanensis]|uniref:Prepilin type IV endopeptidase peptidase domain-containing protein n=1 Tax=Amycolatopsis taiwanensis TaxID=342230 RepID=A0A9W6R8M1_9PSEU|nr:prepilin peptidase [Amycolatopsis taiwanensis]GLY71366.1 hypothetical protein Atai01_79850 [Amycolatopsis taiwanensis]
MAGAFVAPWMGAGILVGAALTAYSRRLLNSTPRSLPWAEVAASLLTGCAFGGLAWRFGNQFDVLPYSVLAAVGATLGLVDVIEQRLPSVLTYSGVTVVGALMATSAILHSRGPDLLRALAGMVVLAVFYLVLALASDGGLGAGDVKLSALLGLALGWSSWSALIAATFLTWFLAGLGWLLLRFIRRRPRGSPLPLGPFLLLGALLTISVFH